MKLKILKKRFCFFLIAAGFVWQTACVAGGNSSQGNDKSAIEKISEEVAKADFPSPSEANFEQEKAAARNLFDGGISFKNTMSAHGMRTERGVSFGSNEFESSDYVKLTRYAKLYDSPEEVKRQFDSALNGASKIYEKGAVKNGEQRFVGATGEKAEIVYTSGFYLYRVSSPSVRHLLAFEIKESASFDYQWKK